MLEIQLAGDMPTQRWIRESTKWNSLIEQLKGIVQNFVAENIYSQCDSEGNLYLVLKEIVDHKSNESALRIGDGYTVG